MPGGEVRKVSEKSIKELVREVEKNKMDVESLVISDLTEQYLDNLKGRKTDTDAIVEFLGSALKLVSLKVKALMPVSEPELSEEEEDFAAQQLAQHLAEYRTFKEAAGLFQDRLDDEPAPYVRSNDFTDYLNSVSASGGMEGLNLGDLLGALEKVLERDAAREAIETFEVPRHKYRVADKIEAVIHLVSGSGASGIAFENLFSERAVKGEIIATFLALLELIRLRQIRVFQEQSFGTIMIYEIPQNTQDGLSNDLATASEETTYQD